MEYLPATLQDLETLYMMGFDTWSKGLSVANYLQFCRDDLQYLGQWYKFVTEENMIVSSMLVYQLPQIAHLNILGFASIATVPEQRQQGYAAKMLHCAIETHQTADAIFLYSDITPSYYEQFGFTALPDAFQYHLPSVCMIKMQHNADITLLLNQPQRLPAYF